MCEDFLLEKTVDKSFLTRGFAIPIKSQAVWSLHLSGGTLSHGEKRKIKILLNNKIHEVTLRSVNFNTNKFPEHNDIWQINYSPNSSIAKAFKEIFLCIGDIFVLYATDTKDLFYAEIIFANELPTLQNVENELYWENLIELQDPNDSQSTIIEKYGLKKIRKLNRGIGNYLKKIYNFRCQICGKNFGDIYGANIAECHHINYFSKSLNNDAKNLLIVCPNHHRIIHAANPIFDSEKKLYLYPNGYSEGLKLNEHL